jgi:ADP-ribose pyrophosphatase YjhB (NUDIX family)
MHLQVQLDGRGFNVRAAGVVVRDGRLLLHWKDHEAMWTLPGGRVEFGESAEEAGRREMEEELGAAPVSMRLLWVVEHFFDLPDGREWHQVGFYYAVALPEGCETLRRDEWTAHDGPVPALYRWIAFEELPRLVVSPSFLATAVAQQSDVPRRLVHRERLFA